MMERSLCLDPLSPRNADQTVSILRTIAQSAFSEALLTLANGYFTVSGDPARSHASLDKRTTAWVADHTGRSTSTLSVVIPALVGACKGSRPFYSCT